MVPRSTETQEAIMIDVTKEAVVRAAIEQNGRVLPSAIEDVLEQFRAGRFAANDTLSFLEKVETESVGLCGPKPHWFVPAVGSDDDLARQAFLFGHATSQAQYVRKFGREAANEAAKLYGNPFAEGVYGKAGVEPETEKARRGGGDGKQRAANPWSDEAWSIQKQNELVRKIGLAAAEGIARSAGSFVGAPRPGAKRLIPVRAS